MGGKISQPVKKMLGKVGDEFNSDKGKVDCGRVSKEKEKEKRPITTFNVHPNMSVFLKRNFPPVIFLSINSVESNTLFG